MCLIASTWTRNANMVTKVAFRRLTAVHWSRKWAMAMTSATLVVGTLLLLVHLAIQTPVTKLEVVGDYEDAIGSSALLGVEGSGTEEEDAAEVPSAAAAAAAPAELSGWRKALCSFRARKPAFPFLAPPFEPEDSGRNIFFVETSCASSINAKMACAVESAARHHERHLVHLLITTRYLSGANTLIHTLASLPNVRLAAANVDVVFRGTLLQEWNQQLAWASGTAWPMINLSDALRLALVCKYGGIYLDLDLLLLAPLPVKDAWIGRERLGQLSNGGFRLPRSHWFCEDAISNFVENYSGKTWSNNGPKMFLRVMEGHCGKIANLSSCRDVHLLEPAALYPLPWKEWEVFFKSDGGSKWMSERSESNVAIHLWNKFSHKKPIVVGDDSIIDLVARENCPSVYAATKEIYKFKYIIERRDRIQSV